MQLPNKNELALVHLILLSRLTTVYGRLQLLLAITSTFFYLAVAPIRIDTNTLALDKPLKFY